MFIKYIISIYSNKACSNLPYNQIKHTQTHMNDIYWKAGVQNLDIIDHGPFILSLYHLLSLQHSTHPIPHLCYTVTTYMVIF